MAMAMAMAASGQTAVHHLTSAETAAYGVEGDLSWIKDPVSLYFEASLARGNNLKVAIDESDAAQVSVFGYDTVVPGVDRELIDGAACFEREGDALTLYGDFDTTALYTRTPEGTAPRH